LTHGALPHTPPGTISHAVAHPPQPGGMVASRALSGRQLIGSQTTEAGDNEMHVTVGENSPPTVIDLGNVFAGMSGIQHDEELRLSVLGNTNADLVKTDLSDGELTLTYTPSQSGTATIMVGATDADGVSVQVNIVVTVIPLTHGNARAGATSSISTGHPMSATIGSFLPAPSVNTII
jgi:hypothetical protein